MGAEGENSGEFEIEITPADIRLKESVVVEAEKAVDDSRKGSYCMICCWPC